MKETLEKLLILIHQLGLDPEPPCSKLEILRMENHLLEQFQMSLPEELQELLAHQNGIFVDDFIIYGILNTEASRGHENGNNDLYQMNVSWRALKNFPTQSLIFGSGDFGLMVFQAKQSQFSLLDDKTFEELESFPSLQALLEGILSTIQANENLS